LRLFTARGGRSLFETRFAPDDVLVFGSESSGLPRELLEAHPSRRVYVPIRPCVRSLNLANVVALATYTALVRAGVPLPDNDGACAPDARADVDVGPVRAARAVKNG
jgi:tRNA (cytidine/uridine-2'-O-)-methyltransferase